MENIIDDALLSIFSHLSHIELDTVACVCTRWSRLVSQLRVRDPHRTAVQLRVYAQPSIEVVWALNKWFSEMRRDLCRMMTRPAFGFYSMTDSFTTNVLWRNVLDEDQRFKKFRTWSEENRRNYDIGHINYDAYCLQLVCNELIRENTDKRKGSRCRLTPADCMFVQACELSKQNGNDDGEDIIEHTPVLKVILLPAHMTQAYRVCTKQTKDTLAPYAANEWRLGRLVGSKRG